MNIYFLSTVHVREDVRVFHNEFKTIVKEYPSSKFIVADGKGCDAENKVVDLGKLTSNRSLRPFLGAITVFKFFRKKERGIIHIHDPELLIVAPFLRLLGFTIFYDVHEDLPRQIYSKHWIPKPLMVITSKVVELIEKSSTFFVDEYFTATVQIANRFNQGKTSVIRNYPSKTIVKPINNGVITHISYLGNITDARGVYTMLDLILLLNKSGISLRLKLGGRFAPEELEAEVSNHEGWAYVDFVGWVNRDDIGTFFEGALCGLVLLKPFTNYLESSPNKLFEYMAMGLPVIASNFPVWKNLIDESDGVFFIEHDDIEGMIKVIKEICNDEIREHIKLKCQNAVLNKYNWESEAVKLLSTYEKYEKC